MSACDVFRRYASNVQPMRLRPIDRCRLLVLCLLLVLAPQLLRGAELAQDTGAAGLQQKLRQLRTTARLLHTTAHPDDEDGAMLTLEARGRGAATVLLTLTRGEGGQNKVGSNLFDVLGVVRTLELLASDQHYGVQQRFSRVADFGYSKTAAETFEKWHGHDIALADMVRVIRTFRPDVVVSRFQGTPRDGHGHHEATGILSREAFRAAADPARFPEQIREGLQPWQAKKLYVDNVRSPMSSAPVPPDAYTVALDTGAKDDVLGASYAQIAMDGLKHQLSQGAGSWNLRAGPHVSYYKLVDSVLPMPAPGTHEQDYFDGIDTSLQGLASRLGSEETRTPFLRPALREIAGTVDQAAKAATNPAAAAPFLLDGLALTSKLIDQIQHSSLSPIAKTDLLTTLQDKREQFRDAANLALAIELNAQIDAPPAPTAQQIAMAIPGQSFTVTATITNRGSERLEPQRVVLDVPIGWKVTLVEPGLKAIAPGQSCFTRFKLDVSPNAKPTRPHWRRSDPERDTIYTTDSPASDTLALPPPPLHARAEFSYAGRQGELVETVEASYRDEHGDVRSAPLWVGPPLSIATAFATQIIPLPDGATAPTVVPAASALPPGTPAQVNVKLGSNLAAPVKPTVRIETPDDWRTEPPSAIAALVPGVLRELTFTLSPPALREGVFSATALASVGGATYSEGYTVVSRADTGAFPYYQPATEHIRAVAVNTPPGLKVGYVEGAGDDIPRVLRQVGFDVTNLSDQDLATADLGRFATIIVGIRAYDTRDAVRAQNQRLLDYVSNGGTLLVQYNTGIGDFNSGHFTPYPAQLSRERVSVEQAPVEMLAPQDPIFSWPNRITARDFDGWIQERGLYFMAQWDPQFEPLLASHDPSEPSQKGGLLRARYGKGVYLYTGYAFFRQLPAGVPGAIRLFVNLVSAGHAPEPTH